MTLAAFRKTSSTCDNPAVTDPIVRVALTVEQCWHRVPGGTAVAALGTARALSARTDADVVGVAARHAHAAPEPWTPPVPVSHLPLPRLALYETWHRVRWPPVQHVTGPVDVVHATTFAIPPKSAPLIVTVHDLAFLRHPGHFTPRGLRLFHRGLELTKKDADIVLCASDATLRACRDAGFEHDRLMKVPFGVDASPASAADVERVKRRYSLPREYILWTGTIEPRKNLAGLLSAYRELDCDIDLVLAGPEGWHEDLNARLRDLREHVRVLGFVPRADLAPLYAGASVFCWPTLLEGFGFPVLEAMAQGTPVVTSRGTSTEELAGDAGVLVDPHDPSSIAAGMRTVLEDEGLARKLRELGPDRAAEYSWDRTGELTAQAYRKALACRRSA
jgi:glycosyltransferase involved in cell wall biosynthesis